jgi:hypothetical protein
VRREGRGGLLAVAGPDRASKDPRLGMASR